MDLAVAGCGYVGLVTAACFADLGNRVVGADVDARRVAALRKGRIPIYEPGLEEIVARNLKEGRLSFTHSLPEAVRRSAVVFIAVGTPPDPAGDVDLSAVRAVAAAIGRAMNGDLIVVDKSTVPVGVGDLVAEIVAKNHGRGRHRVDVVSNPEFLREGSAVSDFMHPDRVVVGARNRRAALAVAELYEPLKPRVVVTDVRSAEMIKYASNAFLATKVSFINEIAAYCEKVGADVREVADAIGMDHRIGRAFLDAGVGFGGSCLPKDVSALAVGAERAGLSPDLLRAVLKVNESQRRVVVQKLRAGLTRLSGRTVAVLGLAFKPDTDDLRDAVSQPVLSELLAAGAAVRAFDPAANVRCRALFPKVRYCRSAYEAAAGADAVCVLTEWNEFKELDLRRLRRQARGPRPLLVDGRNIYAPEKARAAGFEYKGIGRG